MAGSLFSRVVRAFDGKGHSLNGPGRRPLWAPLVLFISSLLFFFSSPADSRENPYAEGLIKAAREKGLHLERDWLVLLHMKRSYLGGYESLIDSPGFFLSKNGKSDPVAELEATLRAVVSEDGLDDDGHAQCRYRARYIWLKEELGMDGGPQAACAEYNELIDTIRPHALVLVFPVAHMNSPASMFGHTLLRVDSPDGASLISYAINYSAVTDETNGLFFAVKGIFGFYRGFFGLMPYYEKIKEYSSLENRDIWEYRLNYTPEEITRVVAHLWELKEAFSYYYFFDENCSYNLLLALEAGRPEIDLINSVPAWVIPADTVKAVNALGLYGSSRDFRPSRASRIRHISALTEDSHRSLAAEIAEGRKAPIEAAGIEKAQRIKTLDLAAEYVQYLYSRQAIDKDTYLDRYLKILGERSEAGEGDEYRIPAPQAPDEGHGTAKLSLGAGLREGRSFFSVGLRPANHDLMDPDGGYLNGAAISFLDIEARYYMPEGSPELERLSLVEIISLAPRDLFFDPVSWNVRAGFDREYTGLNDSRTLLKLSGGPGLTYQFLSDGLAYGFLDAELKSGGGLEDGYSSGAGARAGLLKPVTERLKVMAQGAIKRFFLGGAHTVTAIEAVGRYTLTRDSALRVNFKKEVVGGFDSVEAGFGVSLYF